MPSISGTKLAIAMLAVAVVLAVGAALTIFNGRSAIEGITKDSERLPKTLASPQGQMLLVGGGRYLMGPEKSPVILRAFYIDRTEVTREAYATLRPLPPNSTGQPGDPVTQVTWNEAKEFCETAGKRLPLPIEWEKAARGETGLIYPWGDDADVTKANVADNPASPKAPMPADSLPAGASRYGALHMAGNVWEWVDDRRVPGVRTLEQYKDLLKDPPSATEPWYALKGGAFDRPLRESISQEFVLAPARYAAPDIGFRCAKDR